MTASEDCVICKLLAGELEVSMVHRDELCSAFMDIQPVNRGHVLVVPNRHMRDIVSLEDEESARMFVVAHRLTRALRRTSLKCEGINFFVADGEAAGQEVFHVHLHIFPRFEGDGFSLNLPPGYKRRPSRKELDATAEMIRKAIE